MNIQEIKDDLIKAIPNLPLEVEGSSFVIPKEKFLSVARFFKESPKYSMDYVSCITAVDYPAKECLESVNHLYSMQKKQGPVVLKVRVPKENPRMPSLTALYRGAEFQEREAYDLFGIIYEGHSDLRRILLWDEFEGHPMRKDYVSEDQEL
ncbi:MAG TPA: NADH-quinone oxidoreductase subunit C [Candidatus Omnitrophota bacterium]|nr:NADH-quinone oxidoreductase subunit C [Candidatus Omnitrophota bacterium]